MTIAGTVVLAFAMGASVFLITEVMLSTLPTSVATGTLTFVVALSWFYLALVTFERIE